MRSYIATDKPAHCPAVESTKRPAHNAAEHTADCTTQHSADNTAEQSANVFAHCSTDISTKYAAHISSKCAAQCSTVGYSIQSAFCSTFDAESHCAAYLSAFFTANYAALQSAKLAA